MISSKTYFNKDLKQPEQHVTGSGEAWVFTRRNPEYEVNEDSCAVIQLNNETAIFVIADGAGGHRGGDQASKLATNALLETLKTKGTPERSVRSLIIDGFELANRRVLDLGIGAATTLVVVEVQGNTVRTYHAGDSIAMVVGQRGRLKYQTVGHTPVELGIEAGLLEEEVQNDNHEMRHIVTNLVGLKDMRIEVGSPFNLDPKDTLVLASDGVTDNLKLNEMEDHICNGSPAEICADLANLCFQRMAGGDDDGPSKPDDFTMIVFRLATTPSSSSK